MLESHIVDLTDPAVDHDVDYEQLYGCIQMFGIVASPLAGFWIDKRRRRELGIPPGTQQMQCILPVMFMTSILSVCELTTSMVGSDKAIIASFIFNLLHRVFLFTSMCSFLMHVHFPHQHIGKLIGTTMAVSALFEAFQFPLRTYLVQTDGDTLQVNIILLCLSIISVGHPLNVWHHCRMRLIRDSPSYHEEGLKESNAGHLTSHQDGDEEDGHGGVVHREIEIRDTNGDVVVVYDGTNVASDELNDANAL